MAQRLTILALVAVAFGCEDSQSWHKRDNTAKDCAWVAAYSPKRCAVKGEANVVALDACPATCGACETCDVGTVKLADFEVWRREEGYWYGEYTFLGAEGDPYLSSSWNYPYDHYYGFIHIELQHNSLVQRNVFIYPPQTMSACDIDNSTTGDGVCGVNGNEKVFAADQSASDCDGNLAGPYVTAYMTLDTTTTVLGNDTVIYAVKLPKAYGGGFNQNQLTTLPGNGVRVRTAQGFSFGAEQPDYASFYREYKLDDQAAWLEKLDDARAEHNVRSEDECAWVTGASSGADCEAHFGFPM